MKKASNSKIRKVSQSLAFSVLLTYFPESVFAFCDFQGRFWLMVGDKKKRISEKEYYLFKELNL